MIETDIREPNDDNFGVFVFMITLIAVIIGIAIGIKG